MIRRLTVMCVVVLMASFVYAKPHPEKIKKHPFQGITDEYVVVLQDGTRPEAVAGIAKELAEAYRLEVTSLFAWSLQGFIFNA